MQLNFPSDIRAEIVANYLSGEREEISFLGNHKRNAYEDILSVTREEGTVRIGLSRSGLYDILPEALFHPIDRFDNIPANVYKERFAEEVELQHIEESNARSFFAIYDRFNFNLNAALSRIKDAYSDNGVLADIICDTMPERYRMNRFVNRCIEFTPRCRDIRGNSDSVTMMLRKVMADEGLRLTRVIDKPTFMDRNPRYDCSLSAVSDIEDLYLGNQFEEQVLRYEIHYWNEDYCDGSFLKFVEEIKVFEDFVNDYFMGIETSVDFNLSAESLPVRLSDELCYNYLGYNTNI